MYESTEEYEAIVRERLLVLEWGVGNRIRHGDTGWCPRCRAAGIYDLDGLGFAPSVDNSIYYSTVFDEWRCRSCDFKMCQ